MNRRSSLVHAVFVCALTAVSCGRSTADSASLSSGYSPASAEELAHAVLPNAMYSPSIYSPPDKTPTSTAVPQPSAVASTPFAVGTTNITLQVDASRRIPVQLWYPAIESARTEANAGRSVVEFEPPGPAREQWTRLIDQATPYFTQRTMYAAASPKSAHDPARMPVVVISHCNECLRFSYMRIAEQLAGHGFMVAAPDHIDGTLYDAVNGTSVGLDMDDFLEQRRLDMFALTDALLDPSAEVIPADLRGRADPERVGMLGHSFGAITTAYASTRDPRIKAIGILTMLVSLDNRLPYAGDRLAASVMLQPLSKPALFVMAAEDRVSLFGINDILVDNFQHYPARAWLATIADTGHYSVSNLCGIVDSYTDGCGPGQRAANWLESFTYLNIDYATDVTAQLVRSFFEQELNGESDTSFPEIAARAASVLTVTEHRP